MVPAGSSPDGIRGGEKRLIYRQGQLDPLAGNGIALGDAKRLIRIGTGDQIEHGRFVCNRRLQSQVEALEKEIAAVPWSSVIH